MAFGDIRAQRLSALRPHFMAALHHPAVIRSTVCPDSRASDHSSLAFVFFIKPDLHEV